MIKTFKNTIHYAFKPISPERSTYDCFLTTVARIALLTTIWIVCVAPIVVLLIIAKLIP